MSAENPEIGDWFYNNSDLSLIVTNVTVDSIHFLWGGRVPRSWDNSTFYNNINKSFKYVGNILPQLCKIHRTLQDTL